MRCHHREQHALKEEQEADINCAVALLLPVLPQLYRPRPCHSPRMHRIEVRIVSVLCGAEQSPPPHIGECSLTGRQRQRSGDWIHLPSASADRRARWARPNVEVSKNPGSSLVPAKPVRDSRLCSGLIRPWNKGSDDSAEILRS